jgi:hypothetical protein
MEKPKRQPARVARGDGFRIRHESSLERDEQSERDLQRRNRFGHAPGFLAALHQAATNYSKI